MIGRLSVEHSRQWGAPKQIPVKQCMSVCGTFVVFNTKRQDKLRSPDMHVRLPVSDTWDGLLFLG